ncbi:MAG: DUF2142 domain-containing protein [Anaerolineae bacterium]|nr:DUF2142 domain-containing protein [Anaerolineae bacterium]
MTRQAALPISLLLIAYLVVGALFAVRTPLWQAPDEPAHYNYIRQLAQDGCCPTIQLGDWDSALLDSLKAERFAAAGDLSSIQYEDHQPPLYYLLQTPLFLLTQGSVIALRLGSVILGAGIVLAAYAITRLLLPQQPTLALATAALVAFLPQHVAILASINNDALGNLLVALTLLALLHHLQGAAVRPWHLGVLVGIGLLTKVSTIFLAGLVPLMFIIQAVWVQRVALTVLVRRLIAFALPALLLGGLWWLRSISVYGFPDLFGLRQHDLVVTGQPRTAELIDQIGFVPYLGRALQTTFNSFWGQFGWMGVPMPAWIYTLLLILCALALTGLLWRSLTHRPAPHRRLLWLPLLFTLLLAVLQYLYYNLVFLQLQGRYMFTGLIPFALFIVLGVDRWRAAIPRLPALLTLLPFLLFIPLDLYLLWRVIVPALAP